MQVRKAGSLTPYLVDAGLPSTGVHHRCVCGGSPGFARRPMVAAANTVAHTSAPIAAVLGPFQ